MNRKRFAKISLSAMLQVALFFFSACAGPNSDLLGAAKAGDIPKIEAALKAGADVDARSGQYTALMLAASYGHVNEVRLLLKAGADVNAKDWLGNTALMDAAANGYADVVAFLLKSGANVSYRNDNGDNAISLAKNSEIRSMILSYIRTERLRPNKMGNSNAEHMDHLPWDDRPLPWER